MNTKYREHKIKMEAQLKTKRIKRTALSKYCKQVESNLNATPPVSLATLERHMSELNARIAQVTDIHNTLTELVKEDDLDNLLSEHDNWLEDKMATFDRLSECITLKRLPDTGTTVQEPSIADDASRGGDSITSLSLRSGIKLTRLDLATFDGTDLDSFADYREDHYTNVYCNKDLTPAMKLSYLRRTCKGEAFKMISGYTLSAKSYKQAWDRLVKRYGRSERTAMRHISALLNLEQPKHERGQAYVNSLYKLLNDVNLHVRSLDNLIATLKAEDILVPLIISKFPNTFLHEFSKHFKGKDTDLPNVLEFLESECQRYEFVSDISQNMVDVNPYKGSKVSGPGPSKGSAVALQVASDDAATPEDTAGPSGGKTTITCAYCKGNHASRVCSKFWKANIGARRELVLQSGLCFRCLKPGHRSRDCDKSCKICGGNHANPLCDSSISANHKGMAKSPTFVQNNAGYTNPHALHSWPTYTHMLQTPVPLPFSGQHMPSSSNSSTISERNNSPHNFFPNIGNHGKINNPNNQTPEIKFFQHNPQDKNTAHTEGFQSVLHNSFPPGGSKTSE